MKEKNNKNKFNGWIFIDKPIGISSNKVLQKVRKIFLNCKAGYVGTLDPLASGFLPIALGKATKTIKYLEKSDKEYHFTAEWGKRTDTGDLEGKVIEETNNFPTKKEIQENLSNFRGQLTQIPSIYSAINIDGKRAYSLAREGKTFKMPEREIKVINFELLEIVNSKKATFSIKCSSGTYIRTFVEDFAKSIGFIAHLTMLKRVGFGNLDKKLISLDSLLSLMHIDKLNNCVKPIDVIFNGVKKIDLIEVEAKALSNGNSISLLKQNYVEVNNEENNFIIATFKDSMFVLGNINKGSFFPKIVMNLN